jgi:hypothetical protein
MLKTTLRLYLIPACSALLALVLLAVPAPAEVVFPPGLRIGLEPPPGMRIDKTSQRFEDPDHNASITIMELPPQLYSEMEKMVFAEQTKPDVTVLKRESFPFANGIGYFVAVRLTVDGKAYRKWILLASSAAAPVSDLATLVSVQVPEEASEAYPESVVRAALASVTFRPIPLEERLGLVPFVISDLGGFKVAQVAPNGIELNDSAQPGGLPRITVSIGSGGPEMADDRERFARDLIQSVPLRDLNIVSAEPMRIRGTPGFEVKAQARDPAGAEVNLVQWIRFGGGGYLRIVAGAHSDDWDRLYPRFRAVRDSIERR